MSDIVGPDSPSDAAAASGWDAIEHALEALYGKAKPFHFGTVVSYELGGPDPLPGISVYRRTEPVPHWHYVTFGFTDLWEKENPDPEVSGFGFELTARLWQAELGDQPPNFMLGVLQNLARYVFQSGNVLRIGHYLDLNSPIALDTPRSEIRAVAIAADPELGSFRSAHGAAEFRQLVGITLPELADCQVWNTARYLDVLRRRLPMLITDVDRGSLHAVPEVAAAARDGAARDGSSCGVYYVDALTVRPGPTTAIGIPADLAEVIGRILPNRIGFDRPFRLAGSGVGFAFLPAGSPDEDDAETPSVTIDRAGAQAIAAMLRNGRGRYSVPGVPLSITVTG